MTLHVLPGGDDDGPVDEVVDLLTTLLEEAQAGRLRAVAVAAITDGSEVYLGIAEGDGYGVALYYGAGLLSHALLTGDDGTGTR